MAQRTDEEQKTTTQRSSSPSFIRPESQSRSSLTAISPEDEAHSEKREHDEVSPSSIRIVLLGNDRVGKSSSGNTILGRRKFNSDLYTMNCQSSDGSVSGRSVCVVDTPPIFDPYMSSVYLESEIDRMMRFSSPGAHAFLIVFDDTFTEGDQEIPQKMEEMFGEEVFKYSIILFTHGDQLRGETIKEIIDSNSGLRALVDQCGGRFQLFNNRDMNNRDQVNDLLQKIDSMIEQNGGGHYNNQMFEEAHRPTREEEERRRREEKRNTCFCS